MTLVDTRGLGAQRITENGVVVEGVEYELDCLIFVMDFEVGTDYTTQQDSNCLGPRWTGPGIKWSDGVRTFHGLHVRGFPQPVRGKHCAVRFYVNFPYLLDVQV